MQIDMTNEQARILDEIARKHKCSPISVAMLASALRPDGWRGCVRSIQSYKPQTK